MRRRLTWTLSAGLLPLILLATSARAWQDQGFAPQPTEQHKMLAEAIGDYDAVIKSWMNGPDAEPMISKGSEKCYALGDFWVLSDFKGDFGGQPFQGHGTMGYDPDKKKFVGTWVDTMASSVMIMEGDYDAATKTMTMYSEGIDPATKQKYKSKNTTVYKDDGTHVFGMYMGAPDGKSYTKLMEITYTKRK